MRDCAFEANADEHSEVTPRMSVLRQVPLRVSVKLPHSEQLFPLGDRGCAMPATAEQCFAASVATLLSPNRNDDSGYERLNSSA